MFGSIVNASLDTAARSGLSQYFAELAAREAMYKGSRREAEAYVRSFLADRYALDDQRKALWHFFGWSPLARLVVDTLATAYLATPSRTLIGPDGAEYPPESAEAAAFDLHNRTQDLDTLGSAFEARSILLNSAWVWAQWDPYEAAARYEIVSPAQIRAEAHPSWPTHVQRCRWIAVERAAVAMTTGQIVPRRFDCYRRQPDGMVTHEVTDDYGRPVKGFPSYPPLRDFPLVRMAEVDSADFYPEGNDDLLAEPLAYALGIAEERFAAKYSAFPQMIVAGLRVQEIATVGPGIVTSFSDPSAQASYLQPGDTLNKAHELRLQHLQEWLRSRKLPPDLMTGDGKVESGIARYMQRLGLIEDRQDRLPQWRHYEAALWNATTAVRLAHTQARDYAPEWSGTPRVVPEDMTMTRCDAVFPKINPLLSPTEEHALLRLRWEDGLESPADQLMRENPGLNETEALQRIADNKRRSAPVAPTQAPDPTVLALTQLAGASGGEAL